MKDIQDQLAGCLRQYRHNDNSGFVTAYEKDGVDRTASAMQAELDQLRREISVFMTVMNDCACECDDSSFGDNLPAAFWGLWRDIKLRSPSMDREFKWRDIGDGRPVKVQVCPMCGVAPSNVDDCGEFGNPECPYFGIGREEYERRYPDKKLQDDGQ